MLKNRIVGIGVGIFSCFSSPVLAATPAVVIVPVIDVWSAPAVDSSTLTSDPRETQLLFGEKVLIQESSGPWARVEAVEQPAFRYHQRWEGYPGWVQKSALLDSIGSPTGILQAAETLIGTPYLWGGLSSSSDNNPARGVDCSGLVHLAFRLNGLTVPRDSYEQWMKSKKLKRAELKPADLIFSAKSSNPGKIVHVALYAGDGMLLEAPQTGLAVRRISFKNKYGRDLSTVESGNTVGDHVIYFGRLLTK